MRIRGRILLRGEECTDPHERIGFWLRKIPLDQFGVGSTIIKNKIQAGKLMLRRDCLVVERPSLDSFSRVLNIWPNSFYLSWMRFSESKTRAEIGIFG